MTTAVGHQQPLRLCVFCGKSNFRDVSDLRRHLRIHTGERPYTCDQCPYSATQVTHLRRHKASKHSLSVIPSQLCAVATSLSPPSRDDQQRLNSVSSAHSSTQGLQQPTQAATQQHHLPHEQKNVTSHQQSHLQLISHQETPPPPAAAMLPREHDAPPQTPIFSGNGEASSIKTEPIPQTALSIDRSDGQDKTQPNEHHPSHRALHNY